MNANAFRHFYEYHFAENRKIWDRYITPLSQEQFTQPWTTLMGLCESRSFTSSVVMIHGSANCEASNPQNLPLPGTTGRASAPTGTASRSMCANNLQNYGTKCCSISR